MANKEVTDLTALTSASADDVMMIVDDPAGSHLAKKITIANLTASLTGIAATQIADGSVSNAEFQFINTLTSNAQTQLDAKQPLEATLTALAAYNTNGLLTQTAADTFAGRTITGTSNQVNVSNGNGVSGNPTLSLPQNIHTAANPTFANLTLDRLTIAPATVAYDLASNALGVGQILSHASTVTVGASTEYDRIRIGSAATLTAYDVFDIGANATVRGLDFRLQAESTSPSSSSLYGVIGVLSNKGAGVTKAIYGRARLETGSTGVAVAGVFAVESVAGGTGWITQLSGTDDTDAVMMIHGYPSAPSTANLADGIVYDPGIRIESGGAFLKGFRTSGHAGDFLNYSESSGGANVFKVDKDGLVTSPTIHGGASAGSTLTIKGTSNGSPSNAHILMQTISSGALPGGVLIGTPAANYSEASVLHVTGPDTIGTAVYADSFGASVQLQARMAGGTAASPTATAADALLFAIAARGYQTTSSPAFAATANARIDFFSANAFTNASQGTYITFATTPIGSTARAERVRITDVGNVKINGTASRGTTEGTGQLVLFNGTAPVGTLTNGVSLYSASGELRVMDSGGTSTLLSPHDDDNYWVFDSTDTTTGKRLKIDVEKLLRFVNEYFGTDFIHEYIQ